MAEPTIAQFREWSILAYRALCDADAVLDTIMPDDDTEDGMLRVLQGRIQVLSAQVFHLHGFKVDQQRLMLTTGYCCEKAVGTGALVCPECAEASRAYSAAMGAGA